MAAETLERRALEYLRTLAQTGPSECVWCGVIHSAFCEKELAIKSDMAAFARAVLEDFSPWIQHKAGCEWHHLGDPACDCGLKELRERIR